VTPGQPDEGRFFNLAQAVNKFARAVLGTRLHEKLRSTGLFRRLRSRLHSASEQPLVRRPKDLWESGKSSEVEFWRRYLVTKGLEWPDDYASRLDPEHSFHERLLKFLPPHGPSSEPIAVLDVGAGPLSVLGRQVPGRTIELTAVDALANEYDRLLDEVRLRPPVRTQQCAVEKLLDLFKPDQFDFVYMQNALDHSLDPLLGILQMLAVVKPGCHVVLFHAVNEAEVEHYEGLHQWNFYDVEKKFVIWNPSVNICVSDLLSRLADITVEPVPLPDKEWLLVSLRKRP
jgi:SAM-dependent methyltransferase